MNLIFMIYSNMTIYINFMFIILNYINIRNEMKNRIFLALFFYEHYIYFFKFFFIDYRLIFFMNYNFILFKKINIVLYANSSRYQKLLICVI